MSNKTISHTVKTTITGNATNTYEICKEIVGDKGDEVAIIQLYPTVGIDNADTMDTTTLHIQNKMRQLGWAKAHMVNLFSKIVKTKPLSADIPAVDTENIKYVKKLLDGISGHGKVVIAWGSSHASNKVVNEAKRIVLEHLMLSETPSAYQLVTENMLVETEGTHILFLGLRHADDEWQLADYPVSAEFKRITALTGGKNKLKKGAKDVLQNKEQA